MSCDPCQYCQNAVVGYQPEYGYYMDGCKAESEVEDWLEYYDKPCPKFFPRLVSDDLYEQLYEEDLYNDFLESEKDD